jgi:regulatory protein
MTNPPGADREELPGAGTPSAGEEHTADGETDREEEYLRAMDRALHFLGYRARSVQEVRSRLRRYGYDDEMVEAVIDRLLELEYLNDETFALILARDLLGATRPRGERVILADLHKKGITESVARAALERALEEAEESPRERVLRAAERWARRLQPGGDIERGRRRLWGYLGRRGFDPALIRDVVDEVLPR